MDLVYGKTCQWCTEKTDVYYIRQQGKFQNHYICSLCIHDKQRRRNMYQQTKKHKQKKCCVIL